MKWVFYITMFILGACIALNLYFLFHISLYKTIYGLILSLSTFVSALIFLITVVIRKRKLKKAIYDEYGKIFSKN